MGSDPPGLAPATSSLAGRVSEVSRQHHVELFATAAHETADGMHWSIPVHAWIYTPQKSRVRKAGLALLLGSKFGLEATAETSGNFDRRANLLFSDNHRRRTLVVEIAGRVVALPPTAPNGQTRGLFRVTRADVDRHAADGRLRVRLLVPKADRRAFEGHVLLVPREGVSVVSDIDDTVKVSHVTDRARLMESTFFRDFEAVPGMGAFYARCVAHGAALHFVSSSPWHLYAPIREMLDAAGFPPATLDLKHIRLKDRTILDLFADPAKTKLPPIERLLAEFPQRRFVLVGDSGERDPEIYAGLARKHPHRVVRILIRNLTGEARDDMRFTNAFAGVDPQSWQVFRDVSEIRLRG